MKKTFFYHKISFLVQYIPKHYFITAQRSKDDNPSDHRILSDKIHLYLEEIRHKQLKLPKLTNKNIRNHYIVIVRNKIDSLQEISERHTPNDKYKYIVTAHTKIATECIIIKPRPKCKVTRKRGENLEKKN